MNKKLISLTVGSGAAKKSLSRTVKAFLPEYIKKQKKLESFVLKKSFQLDELKFMPGSTVVTSNNNIVAIVVKHEIYLHSGQGINNLMCLIDGTKLIGAKVYKKTQIDGLLIKPGSEVYFYEGSHNIKSCVLSENKIINGVPVKKDCYTSFFEDGNPQEGTLFKDTFISGYEFKRGESFEFRAPKVLANIFLEESKVIDGWRFAEQYGLFFLNNQKVWTGTLAETVNYNGLIIPAESDVYFDENGSLVGVEIEAFSVNDKGKMKEVCFGGIDVRGVRVVTSSVAQKWECLPEALTLKNYTFPAGSYLEFEDGYLSRIETREFIFNNKINSGPKSHFLFDKTGRMTAY